MAEPTVTDHPRILVVDDNPAIHEDFRKILCADCETGKLDKLEDELFGDAVETLQQEQFRIDSAYQGQEALSLVEAAIAQGDPYHMAFVDIRMPPGWDGVETLERLWQRCPDLQAVICTAYSDYSWDEMTRRLSQTDNLLILKKPFDTVEVLQMAHAMTNKWALARQARLRMEDLDRMVQERTRQLRAEMEERARVQEALRGSEERFIKAFSANPLAMAIQTCASNQFVDANPSFCKLTGYEPGQLLEHTPEELELWVKAEEPESPGDNGNGAVHGGNQSCTLRRRDGKTRSTVLWSEPLTLGSVPCRLLILEDISEQQRLETRLRQAEKMEAIGCLASGIAHEFNNVLTVIQGHASLLKAAGITTPYAAESIERIQQASERAASLTRRLMAFHRQQSLQLTRLDLNNLLRSLGKSLGRLLGERYEIQLDCAANLPPIRADESHLEQTIMHLAQNAREAMPEGGTLRLSTSLVTFDQAACQEHPQARPGRFVCVSLSDTGCGIAPEVINRIFDPFFTTKQFGKGAGLGLSTVQGIVQQHQGWVEVTSQVGCGSTFRVFLPTPVSTPEPVKAEPFHASH
jgi:PAS domain S-box-containing protein